jgi:hypothetical protein
VTHHQRIADANYARKESAAHLGDEVQHGVQLVPVRLKRHHHAAAHDVERLLEVAHDEHLGRLAAHVEEVDMAVVPARREAGQTDGGGRRLEELNNAERVHCDANARVEVLHVGDALAHALHHGIGEARRDCLVRDVDKEQNRGVPG